MKKYTITVEVQVDMELIDQNQSRMLDSRVGVFGPREIALSYPDGRPTKEGLEISSSIMAIGISNNIHYGHGKKLWDSAQHLRKVIHDLEELFVKTPEISIGKFERVGGLNQKK